MVEFFGHGTIYITAEISRFRFRLEHVQAGVFLFLFGWLISSSLVINKIKISISIETKHLKMYDVGMYIQKRNRQYIA